MMRTRKQPRRISTFRWDVALLISAGVVIFVLAVAFVPEWWVGRTSGLTTADRITAVGGVRQSMVFLGGGVLALVGIYYTHQRHVIERDTNRLQQDSNYTDRYTAAVTQLGSDQQTIRLGGVYALERIARDSDGDRETVQDVLAAFIRADAGRAQGELDQRGSDEEFAAPPDIAAATTVLSRRKDVRAPDRPRIDLGGARIGPLAFLPTASVRDINFSNVYLVDAILNYVDLSRVNMDAAIMSFAHLSEASLRGTNFNGAVLSGANLDDADLTDAFMDGADLHGADLSNANLTSANLSYARLTNAKMSGANFEGTRLYRTDLSGANLSGARNWSANELESARAWSAATTWPDGFTPSAPSMGE